MTNFVTAKSIYGDFILNRHDRYQYVPLKNKQIPHINEEIEKIIEVISDLGSQPVVIDGGANIGLVTISVARKTNAKIYSFEPQRQIFYCLCGNVVINNLENIFTFNQGLGNTKTTMYVPEIDYTKGRDFGDVELSHKGNEPVLITTIDDLNLEKLDFVKLDIESMEIAALEGGRNSIRKHRPWCWIEYIKSDINDFIDYFRELDYNLYIVDEANLVASPTDKVYSWMKEKL
jgi:FkbM family methyltransferase